MKIYTIGFTKKRAEIFFELLRQNGIQRLLDIRLNPGGQLSGFAKHEDLPYFLYHLSSGCRYIHIPDLAPTKEILNDFRTDGNWSRYEARFENLMEERKVSEILSQSEFDKFVSCLLCSEPTPVKCHRRLVAERLVRCWPDVEIIHL